MGHFIGQVVVILIFSLVPNGEPATFQDRTVSGTYCDTQYTKIGCFIENKNDRMMPVRLFSDLGPFGKFKQTGDTLDVKNWTSSLQSLTCRCADETKRLGNKYFALQSLGECWTSQKSQRVNFHSPGPSSDCVGLDFEGCDDDSDTECVGQRLTNYIYKIPEKETISSLNMVIPGLSLSAPPGKVFNKLKEPNGVKQRKRSSCSQKLDLVFVIDGSGSIEESGNGNFKKCLQFVKSVIKAYSVSEENTHVGVIVYGTKPKLILDLNHHNNIKDIDTIIDTIEYPSTGSNTGTALNLAKTELFQKSSRPGTSRMLLLMTDGKSYDDVITPALELKALGVTMFALGLGESPDADQLSQIASDPISDHLMKADFNDLEALGETMADIKRTCEIKATSEEKNAPQEGKKRSNPLLALPAYPLKTLSARRPRKTKINGVIRRVWKNIDQYGLPMLKTDLRFPSLPDEAEMIATFDAPVNVSDFYGQQLSTFFVPPESGMYTFVTSCNKACELWLSNDRNPSNIKKIITQDKATPHNKFDIYPTQQQSTPVKLEEGKCYFLQALMTSSQGGDNLSVGVKYPMGRLEAPLDNDSVFVQCPNAERLTTNSSNVTKKINDMATPLVTRRHGNPKHKMFYPIIGLGSRPGKPQGKEVYIANCFDSLSVQQCSFWSSQGLCENPSMFGPDVKTVRLKCKRTCGVCKPRVVSI